MPNVVTIKQIAAEAGVSTMTVSNVINKNYKKVSKKTAKRINDIIKKYNYVPNMSARSLSTNESRIVALLLPAWSKKEENILDDPYSSRITGLLETHLRGLEYFVMLHSFHSANDVLHLLQYWNVDGAIIVFPHMDEITKEVVNSVDIPIVVIDRYFNDIDTLSVNIDDYRGGFIATKHLIDNGHRKIAFVGPSPLASIVVHDRFDGFINAMNKSSIPINPDWIFNVNPNYECGVEVGQKLCKMKDRPTAIMTTVDILAIGIMEGMRLNGLFAPDDFSITGFDNDPISQYCTPKLTTIAQNIDQKASCAVKLLYDTMHDRTLKKGRIILDVELIERESVKKIV